MFDHLSDRLSGIFNNLTRRGALSEREVTEAMREIRVALLEADVALPVVKSFVRTATRKATGQAVMKSISPADMVIKIVHDEIVRLLEGDQDSSHEMRIDQPPATILMVGLQGSGKTTSSVKIAKWLNKRQQKRVLMASLDTRRPAAMEQLKVLGEQAEIDTLPIFEGLKPTKIAERAIKRSEIGGYDTLILDTAGRMHVDQEMMQEVIDIRTLSKPRETLLVLDGLTGQDAVNTAAEFDQQLGISGVVLTRMEGDGRGGAALSMRAVTGKPIRFVGTGEKIGDIEKFDSRQMADRILGMGDIVALVEKASEVFAAESQERMRRRLERGVFTLNDFRRHLESMEKMGGLGKMLSLLPGAKGIAAKAEAAGVDDNFVRCQIAIINSMTKTERLKPSILQASRRRRIAAGCGQNVSDVNRLMKTHLAMSKMVKTMAKKDKRGFGAMMSSLGLLGKKDNNQMVEQLLNQTNPGLPGQSLSNINHPLSGKS